MAQYIPKSALVAELEKTYKFHEKRGNEHDSSICDVLYGLSHRINTLEVKEVDLEKEIAKYLGDDWVQDTPKEVQLDMIGYARHFFELGLKAQKGE